MSNRKWNHGGDSMRRRDVLALGVGLAAAAAVPSSLFGAQAPAAGVAALGRRKLGALEVSALGLGCMSMAGFSNPPPDRQARAHDRPEDRAGALRGRAG